MTPNRFARAQWAATISILGALAACGTDTRVDAEEGAVAITASALSSADVAKVTITITAPDLAAPIVTDLVKVGGKWQGIIGKIPAGTNRKFHGDAYTAANAIVYAGEVNGVTIQKNTTAAISLLLQQSAAPIPFTNSAPVIDGMVASSGHVAVGDAILLDLTAHDVDPGDALTYDWSASGGTVTPNAAGTAATWAANVVGDYTITARVTDSKGSISAIAFSAKVDAGKGDAAVSASFNTWPLVSGIVATPSRIDVGGTTAIALNASDVDGDAATYAWTASCAGVFDDASARNPTFTLSALPASGTCDLNVAVSDGRDGVNTGKLTIKTGPAPVADIAPEIDTTFQSTTSTHVGYQVVLRVGAHDPNGGAVTFDWTAAAGTLGALVSTATTSEVRWQAPACGGPVAPPWTISALVHDSTGNTTPVSFSVALAAGGCDWEPGTLLVQHDRADNTSVISQISADGSVLRELGAGTVKLYTHLAFAGGLAYRSNGDFVPNRRIDVFDVSGSQVRTITTATSPDPRSLQITGAYADSSILFTDTFAGSNSVYHLDNATTGASTHLVDVGGTELADLFMFRSGGGSTLYALNTAQPPATADVTRIDAAYNKTTFTNPNLVIPYVSDLGRIVVDASGAIYVATSQQIVKMSPTGTTLATFATPDGRPSLAIDASGALYYGHFGTGAIDVFDSAGAQMRTIQIPGATKIKAITVVAP